MSAMIAVNDEFINLLAEAIAKANLRAGGLLPTTTPPPDAENGSQGLQGHAESATESDPWASTAGEAPGTTPASATQDPWSAASPTPQATGQQPPSNPATTVQPAQPLASGTITISTANGMQTVEFGKYGAPPCQHGQPAAHYSGNKNGRDWKAWRCALGATQRWKEKCGFSQWA